VVRICGADVTPQSMTTVKPCASTRVTDTEEKTMAIGREGTFAYVVRIPQGAARALPWRAKSEESLGSTERRLLGHSSKVQLEKFEPRPGVTRTRIRLIANDVMGRRP
jgi:hypothetical protein